MDYIKKSIIGIKHNKKVWSKDMEFREVILSRKSVRSFSNKEVGDEKFTKIKSLIFQITSR